jgi:hypothetical protein
MKRRRAPVVIDAGGVRVRIVAVSDHPSSYAAGVQRPGIAFADLAGAPVPPWLRIASAPNADADMTIVLPHWGPNMRASPVPHGRRGAAALQAAGATLIAGHSAHVPQGPSGRTLFDLGDFIDDYAVDPGLRNDLGVLWLVTLDAEGPRRVEGVPLRLEFAHTRLAARDETRLLHSLLQERCAAVGSGVHQQGDRLIFEAARARGCAAGRLATRACPAMALAAHCGSGSPAFTRERHRVAGEALERLVLGSVEPERLDPDQRPARTGLGPRHLAYDEPVRPVRPLCDHCSHLRHAPRRY